MRNLIHSFNAIASRSLRQDPPVSGAPGWHWRQRLSARRHGVVSEQASTSQLRTPKMARIEAALFVAPEALSARKLSAVATLADHKEALCLIDQLNEFYDAADSAFRVERVAAGYKLLTRPHLASWLDRVHSRQEHLKLTPPAMETLTVIAYRQPCTRADIEAVRGVQSAEMIKQLLDRGLIRVVGEDDSLGRPYLYGTTRLFLESYGLSSLDDLPMADSLRVRDTAEESGDTADDVELVEPGSVETVDDQSESAG